MFYIAEAPGAEVVRCHQCGRALRLAHRLERHELRSLWPQARQETLMDEEEAVDAVGEPV
jgi:hypothetical protein